MCSDHTVPAWFPLSFTFGRSDASASIRAAIDRRNGVYSVCLKNVRFDSRFIPPGGGSRVPWHFVVCALGGTLQIGDVHLSGPDQLVVLRDRMLTSGGHPGDALRTLSSRAHAVLLRVHPDDLRVRDTNAPYVHVCKPETLAAFDAVGSSLRDESFPAAALHAQTLIDRLEDEGLVQRPPREGVGLSVRDAILQRFAGAVFPLLSELVTRPMLVDVIARAGISERQFLRTMTRVQDVFDLQDRGFRSTMVRWRATAAVLLASSRELSFDEVATLAGYSNLSAMHRALRSFGLPTPLAIRESTKGAEEGA